VSQLILEPGNRDQIPMDELLKSSWQARQLSRPRIFETIYPSGTLPVSVTGTTCSLKCSHCGGRYLEHMATIDSLDRILPKKNPTSILLSGGCNISGQVPLASKIGIVRRKLAEYGYDKLKVNAHPGVVNQEEAAAIANFASVISFDFVLDDLTIKTAFGGHWTGQDYVNAFRNLCKGKARVVPHILIGLYKGQIRGEYETVKFLIQEGIKEIIFIVFIPTPRTRWERLSPPDAGEVLRLIAWTRVQNPNLKISLGCMRPKGRYSEILDARAVEAGVDAIVLPHSNAVREARNRGLIISRKEECCAFD